MFKCFIFILLFFQANGEYNNTNYFCKLKCNDKNNTACSRENCDVSPNCGPKAVAVPFNDEERIAMVEMHNVLRNEIAQGSDPRFPKATASNMRVINYDKELEYVAQCWTNECEWLNGKFNDVCRKTSKFENVGQNRFMNHINSLPSKYDYMNFTSECINHWFSGINYTNSTLIDSFNETEKLLGVGHYTQIIWAETTHFGCGRTDYVVKGQHFLTIICNYGPGGNILGQPVHKRGKPCSDCNPKICNPLYNALCGEQNSLADDTWVYIGESGNQKSKCSTKSEYFYKILTLLYFGLKYYN